jgi:hypothetical protein
MPAILYFYYSLDRILTIRIRYKRPTQLSARDIAFFYYSLDRILTISFKHLTWSIKNFTNTEISLLDLVIFVIYLV